MSRLFKRYIVYAFLNLITMSMAEAHLPEIGKAEFLEAVTFSDSLYRNVDCKYTIDQQFNKAIYPEPEWPPDRKLEIHWRREGIRDYVDVTSHDGYFVDNKPVRHILAHNGEGRKQWTPNENKGSIFKDRYMHSWPVPIDFGLTLGHREKKLGQSLAESEIMNIRKEKCQGHECYFVEVIRLDGLKAEAWIDPEIGWRARRLRVYGLDGLIERDSVAEFKDCGNGTWFPVEGVFRLYGNDPNSGKRVLSNERRLKVEQVTVNADLTQEDFDIQFPPDTRVYDRIYGIGYVVGVTSLDGIEDTVLDNITEAAQADRESGNEIQNGGKSKKIIESEVVNTSVTEKKNEESTVAETVNPVGSVGGSGGSHLLRLISIVISGALLVMIVFVSRIWRKKV